MDGGRTVGDLRRTHLAEEEARQQKVEDEERGGPRAVRRKHASLDQGEPRRRRDEDPDQRLSELQVSVRVQLQVHEGLGLPSHVSGVDSVTDFDGEPNELVQLWRRSGRHGGTTGARMRG